LFISSPYLTLTAMESQEFKLVFFTGRFFVFT